MEYVLNSDARCAVDEWMSKPGTGTGDAGGMRTNRATRREGDAGDKVQPAWHNRYVHTRHSPASVGLYRALRAPPVPLQDAASKCHWALFSAVAKANCNVRMLASARAP
jgi:hypothetical protein